MLVFLRLVVLIFVAFQSISVFAKATVNSQCYFRNRSNSKIQGIRIDQRYKIASVSKIMASHWAATTLGPNYRFRTGVFVENDGLNTATVHLAGDLNPFFDLQMLQNLVSELNKMGIRRISRLTFDENFVYSTTIRFNHSLAHSNDIITKGDTKSSLRRDLAGIASGYSLTFAKAQLLFGAKLTDRIQISVKDVAYLNSSEYRPSGDTKIFSLSSTPLHRILKEMNRNSNNYVADLIFEKLGGAVAYKTFIKKRLGYDESQIRFVNGSGYPVYIEEEKLYNEASCGASIQVLIDLKNILVKEGLDLEDVLPVAGANAKGENSTVGRIYNTGNTRGTLIAKTGTVNDTISLAGMISAEEGDIFFGIFYRTNGSKKEVYQAYEGIRHLVEQWTKEFGGKNPIDYKAVAFLPFDQASGLTPVNEFKGLRARTFLSSIDNDSQSLYPFSLNSGMDILAPTRQ